MYTLRVDAAAMGDMAWFPAIHCRFSACSSLPTLENVTNAEIKLPKGPHRKVRSAKAVFRVARRSHGRCRICLHRSHLAVPHVLQAYVVVAFGSINQGPSLFK